MFHWYRNAQVCYAYLSDVVDTVLSPNFEYYFSSSQWFSRGWTLQELLAPRTIIFFNQSWQDIGTKSILASVISRTTGIEDIFGYQSASVAQKLSWAAKRKTKRVEDLAYCLLGLFDINMPLLYGEGTRAFWRLQLAILERWDDDSLFAWRYDWGHDVVSKYGLLAPNPSVFAHSGKYKKLAFDPERPPYLITNKGLRIDIPKTFLIPIGKKDLFFLPLNCWEKGWEAPIGIYLKSYGLQKYNRVKTDTISRHDQPLLSNDGQSPPGSGRITLYIQHQEDGLRPKTESWNKISIAPSPIQGSGFSFEIAELGKTRFINIFRATAGGGGFTQPKATTDS
jgi:hypothetical protein